MPDATAFARSVDRRPLVAALRIAGCVFAEDEAEVLVSTAASTAELDAMVARRVAGEPLEVVVGWAEFCGLRILVDAHVFVPRRRTEFLVERAAALSSGGSVVVDLCCGAGAIGAALASLIPGIDVFAVDIEPAAVRCARRNLPPERVFTGDLYDALPPALRGRIDVLAVNAPYVPTESIALMPPEARDHEPRVALDGGADGLDLHRRIAAAAPPWLARGGHLLIETSERQAPTTAALMVAAGLTATIARSDDHDATVVTATAP